MCNRYGTPRPEDISNTFQVALPLQPYRPAIGPMQDGPFVFAGQAHVGQWGLIPDRSPTRIPTGARGNRLSTNNCRSEGMAKSWTFARPWARGQRCLIPAADFDEPYYQSTDKAAKNTWWRFCRADGLPWALAGLYNDWTDAATGEVVRSYTMLTVNADAHPVMRLMHKAERDKAGEALPTEQQDKRSVISIERGDWDQWLSGSADQALALIKPPSLDVIAHGPADPASQVRLPL